MRPIERIDNFIKKVDWIKLLHTKWKVDESDIVCDKISSMANPSLIEIWKQNPDQRIGQLLINLGLIDDSIERWCTEEYEILIDQGSLPEDCVYWTSIYAKDRTPLDIPETRLISDLTVDHIQNIIKFMRDHKGYVKEQTMQAFKNVLAKNGIELSEDEFNQNFEQENKS
jgi:hypothetical protein